ncbi:FHA domain-containing protein, partial [bacterium]
GLIGGAIGAAAGAGVFDLVGATFAQAQLGLNGASGGAIQEVGSVPRALFAAALGGGIGLFIGLVDLLARSAWIRLELGRNEGKEWSLDHATTFIGRSESSQIPLFGDPNVAPMHAAIKRMGKNQYVLEDGGSPIGTYVNGQRVASCQLVPGCRIQIAGFQLVFLMKDGKAPAYVPDPGSYPRPQPGQYMAPGGMAPAQTWAPQAPSTSPGGMGGVPNQTVAYPGQGMGNQTVAYPGAQAAMATLVVLDGPLVGQRIPLLGPIVLGRESQQVPMQYDTMASRQHAEVGPAPGGAMVRDLNSTNGTFVNGSKVSGGPLRPGDVLKVGSTSFRIE